MEFKVGSTSYNIPEHDNFHLAVIALISTEEKRIIKLSKCGIKTEEYVLIHFVRMYILRWALAIVEIENNGQLSQKLIPEIQKRYWLCMYGRALDDIHDRDSQFFSLADSCILLTTFAGLLNVSVDTSFGRYIIHATKSSLEFSKDAIETDELTFEAIEKDVCVRVAYFQSLPNIQSTLAILVDQYIGVLLGKADLDDCIADGATGEKSTLMSRHLYKNVADNEQKLHFDNNLNVWYQKTFNIVIQNTRLLIDSLRKIDANYSSDLLLNQVIKWELEHNEFSNYIHSSK
jgi:hypothetical protein